MLVASVAPDEPAKLIADEPKMLTVPLVLVMLVRSTETVPAVVLALMLLPSPSCGTPQVGVVPSALA